MQCIYIHSSEYQAESIANSIKSKFKI